MGIVSARKFLSTLHTSLALSDCERVHLDRFKHTQAKLHLSPISPTATSTL
jgi:hypothetical protein